VQRCCRCDSASSHLELLLHQIKSAVHQIKSAVHQIKSAVHQIVCCCFLSSCLLQARLYVVVFVVAQTHPDAPGHRGGGGAELQARGLLQDPADMEGRGLGVQRENEVTNISCLL
jgi:hypothetical protein